MHLNDSFKLQLDQPVFEWCRFAPAVSSAISCSCTADNSNAHPSFGRYIYYLIAATSFWRYDTWSDTYLQLSSPPITPITWTSLSFSGATSIESPVLSATSNTITGVAYFGKVAKGFDINIISGTGVGQKRLISDVSDYIEYDLGVATAVSNTLGAISITDTTKSWAINQWSGYQVRIVFGSGIGQVRKILYNTATVLTLADSTISGYETFCNPMTFSPAISSAGGSQSIYQIEAQTITIDTDWLVTPDTTSKFKIDSGSIYLVSSAAATPFYTLQQYDILSDTWYIRTANTLNIAAVGTDGTLERNSLNGSLWEKGVVVSGTTTTLTDTSKSWDANQWVGYYVRIYSGTGENQLRLITSNTQSTLTCSVIGIAPDETSKYIIEGFDNGTATSGTVTTLVDTSKSWEINRWKNYMVRITSGTNKGDYVQILSNTSNTLTFVTPLPVGIDNTSVYTIHGDTDKLYIALGANAGMLIHNLYDDLSTYGRLNDSGLASNGLVRYSTWRPIAITSLSNATTTATVTTTHPHNLKVGFDVAVSGATDSNFNGLNFTILSVPSTTTFTYTMGGTPASTTLANTQSTTTLSDASKQWSVNQYAGYMVWMTTTAVTAASGLATGQSLQIASNTATTLTFVTGTAPTNGVSRYVITPRDIIGSMFNGIATGAQSTTLLTDTNVSTASTTASISGNILTVTNVSAGYLGIGSVITGGATLSGTTIIGFGPNTIGGIGTYIVNKSQTVSSGSITSTGWTVNYFAGRRVKFLGGTGQSQEAVITSNTSNALTIATVTTAPVTLVTSYSIMQQSPRGVAFELNWAYGTSDIGLRGKRMHLARGGGVLGFDYIDITTDKFEIATITPQIETLTTGSMFTYDGEDRLYFTKDVTQRIYYIDLVTNTIHGAGFTPYTAGAAIIGNRMEIYTTIDGLKYLWINRHSNLECFRAILPF